MELDFTGINLPYLSYEKIEEVADAFRISNWGSSIPVNIDWIIEYKLKIDLIPHPNLKYYTGVEALLASSLDKITYDSSILESRIVFSIAHEIGHFVLHKEAIKFLRPSSIDGWKSLILKMPQSILSKAETQANIFASYFLIPSKNILTLLDELKDDITKAKDIIGDDYETLIDYLIPSLSKKFAVTRSAMYFRLKNFEGKFNEFIKKGSK